MASGSSLSSEIDFDDPVPEPEADEGTGPADIAPASHTNAMLHLDSSHHHAEFDEFIGATSNM
eukprot:COSAG02_NODE_63392_length_263_cov_0.634146_1_plen_63_part_10